MGLEILNKLKKEKGLTTKTLSEKSGVPKGTLDKILNGTTTNPAYETIVLLSKALECPIDIFTDEDIKTLNQTKVYSKEEEKHIDDLRKLNDIGKKKVITYTKDLTEMPKYQKQIWEEEGKEFLMPIAAHEKEGEFTEEDYKHDDDLMKDDDFWNK